MRRFTCFKERMPPATFELRHLHERTHQLFFILEGEATVELDDERFVLEVGDCKRLVAD